MKTIRITTELASAILANLTDDNTAAALRGLLVNDGDAPIKDLHELYDVIFGIEPTRIERLNAYGIFRKYGLGLVRCVDFHLWSEGVFRLELSGLVGPKKNMVLPARPLTRSMVAEVLEWEETAILPEWLT